MQMLLQLNHQPQQISLSLDCPCDIVRVLFFFFLMHVALHCTFVSIQQSHHQSAV